MNIDINKLEKEIKDYKANFFSSWNDEKYKWEAVSWFQSHWDIKSPDFTQMLKTSLSKTQNLLGAQHYFPRRMIKNFAMVAPEDVRKMFIDLYNEHIPLSDRIYKFIKESDFILEKYNQSTWRNHFQDYRTISTYLWLRYPERYYIFKPREFSRVSQILNTSYTFKKGATPNTVLQAYELYNEIKWILQQDTELKAMLSDVLTRTPNCDPDFELTTTTVDFLYFLDKNNQKSQKKFQIAGKKQEKNIPPLTPPTSKLHYWWLKANPQMWSLSNWSIGEIQSYTLYNDNGNKRRVFQNFLDAEAGDIAICYEATPTKQVVALAKIYKKNDGKHIYFQKTESLTYPIDYSILKNCEELNNMEFFANPNGSLFKLTQNEYDFIMDIIRDTNPIKRTNENIGRYTDEDFLNDVFLDEQELKTLKSILKYKKNIILQGAPGVGKTYSAKRLAYTIMGEKDDSRISIVQFHQNYSYEDFVMGYKPQEEKFELKKGIFYKSCITAGNDPEHDYFFIIDEINRGNMSKIFGELLMLIEKDYRNVKIALAHNGELFSVPNNLHIIGMMNTADRSLAMIDYALRRRFCFYNMKPGFDSIGFQKYQNELHNTTFDKLIETIKRLNDEISRDESLGDGFQIGHSYLCGLESCDKVKEIIFYDIIPMLHEYWFDDKQKVDFWENELKSLF